MENRFPIQRPGLFGIIAAADNRRSEFDAHNEILIYHNVPIHFIFIGDSITHLWELQTYFTGKGRVVNRGIGGDTTAFMLKRLEADVIQLKPTFAVFKIGINNTWILDEWVHSKRLSEDVVEAQIISDMRKATALCQTNKIKPILCSILPTCIDSNAFTLKRNLLIIRVNAALKQLSEEQDAIYIDYHSAFAGEDGITLQAELAYDGIHPNVFGYNLMSEILRDTLESQGINI